MARVAGEHELPDPAPAAGPPTAQAPGRARRARPPVAGAVVVAAVALARADAGLVGALAPALRHHLDLDDTQIGLLASLASVTGAVCVLPAGRLVDRRSRRAVMAVALVLWSLALGVAGLATGFALLAAGRLVSGAMSTAARPAAVSVIGERFPPANRARALARLDAAQTAGTAGCYLIAAAAVALGSWRLGFFALAAVGVVLAAATRRMPRRIAGAGGAGAPQLSLLTVVSIPTNVVVLAADSVGNFFFAGATSFSVLMVTERFGLSTATADVLAPAVGVAVIAGILGGGKLGDHLARAAGGSRRLVLACGADVIGAAILLPALLSRSLATSAVFLVAGAASLGAAGPCLDAVRVDIMPAALRGRAEAARGLLTLASSAAGPLTFGALAGVLGGRRGAGAGLDRAFLVMLVPLAVSGLVLLLARGTYPRDARAAGTAPVPI